MIRKTRIAWVLATLAGMALAFPSVSVAAEVIGENGPVAGCAEDTAYVNTQATDPGYSPSTYGVITAWSAMGDGTAGETIQLLVLRPNPSAGATHFIPVQKDQVRAITQLNQLNTFTSGVRIPIEAEERLGLYIPAGQPGSGNCDFGGGPGNEFRWFSADPPLGTSSDFSGGPNTRRLNASARVEPDADRDGFGDESQDQCPTNATTQGQCPVSVTGQRAAALKKCKKKAKKKHWTKKKLKKCKKKARKLPV